VDDMYLNYQCSGLDYGDEFDADQSCLDMPLAYTTSFVSAEQQKILTF